jgi:hypothetical protein
VVVKVGKPRVSHVSLTGLASRRAKLSFTVKVAGNAPAIKAISVSLPRGLTFARKAKALTRGITVRTGNGARLKFTVKLRHGTLQITLKRSSRTVRVTIGGSAIKVAAKLANAVRHRKIKRLTVVLRVTDTSRHTSRAAFKLKVR